MAKPNEPPHLAGATTDRARPGTARLGTAAGLLAQARSAQHRTTTGDAVVSVQALLRREGRGPHAVDRRLVPRLVRQRAAAVRAVHRSRTLGLSASAVLVVGSVVVGGVMVSEPTGGSRGPGPPDGGGFGPLPPAVGALPGTRLVPPSAADQQPAVSPVALLSIDHRGATAAAPAAGPGLRAVSSAPRRADPAEQGPAGDAANPPTNRPGAPGQASPSAPASGTSRGPGLLTTVGHTVGGVVSGLLSPLDSGPANSSATPARTAQPARSDTGLIGTVGDTLGSTVSRTGSALPAVGGVSGVAGGLISGGARSLDRTVTSPTGVVGGLTGLLIGRSSAPTSATSGVLRATPLSIPLL